MYIAVQNLGDGYARPVFFKKKETLEKLIWEDPEVWGQNENVSEFNINNVKFYDET